MRISILLISLLLLNSCSLFSDKEEELDLTPIARVDEDYLYLEELEGVVPSGISGGDSSIIVDNYIQSWIKEKLILQKAELNLDEQKHNFQKQLEDYRKSLVIYTYEKEYIKQNLDTNVQDEDVQKFYEENKQNLKLKDDIVKVKYLKVLKTAPKVKKMRKLYTSKKANDEENLKELAHQYSVKFHLDDSLWISFEELRKEVPIEVSQTKGYLKNIKNIEVEDSLSYYFVSIKDYRLKNDVSPLSFETNNIRNIILNKRKLKLMNKVKSDLYQDAFLKKKIEIYRPKNEE